MTTTSKKSNILERNVGRFKTRLKYLKYLKFPFCDETCWSRRLSQPNKHLLWDLITLYYCSTSSRRLIFRMNGSKSIGTTVRAPNKCGAGIMGIILRRKTWTSWVLCRYFTMAEKKQKVNRFGNMIRYRVTW